MGIFLLVAASFKNVRYGSKRVRRVLVWAKGTRTHKNASGEESTSVNFSRRESNLSKGWKTDPPPVGSAI